MSTRTLNLKDRCHCTRPAEPPKAMAIVPCVVQIPANFNLIEAK